MIIDVSISHLYKCDSVYCSMNDQVLWLVPTNFELVGVPA